MHFKQRTADSAFQRVSLAGVQRTEGRGGKDAGQGYQLKGRQNNLGEGWCRPRLPQWCRRLWGVGWSDICLWIVIDRNWLTVGYEEDEMYEACSTSCWLGTRYCATLRQGRSHKIQDWRQKCWVIFWRRCICEMLCNSHVRNVSILSFTWYKWFQKRNEGMRRLACIWKHGSCTEENNLR